MTEITHHIPDHLIRAYAAGSLSQGFSLVVATHVSQCDDCRARLEAEECAGGAVLDALSPLGTDHDDRLVSAVLAALDAPPPPDLRHRRDGIYPGPLVDALGGRPPRWRPLGGGIRQMILTADSEGSARLLYIPAGEAVPDHGHNGLEMTLVLQGSFSDCEGRFSRGDVECAHDEIDHQPVAGEGEPCICLAATDAPLRFRAMIPRLLQPIFRI